MIEYNPDVFEGHHYKILLLLDKQDYDEAEKALIKAQELFPDDQGFIFDKVLLLERQNKFSEALDVLENELNDNDSRVVLIEKAKILLAQEKIEESTALFNSIKENEGDDFDGEVRSYLNHIYMNTNQYEKVLNTCNEIIEKKLEDSNYYSAIFLRAECLNKSGMLDESKEAYEEAIKVLRFAYSAKPNMLELIVYRILCHKALKQYDKALEMANYIIALNDNIGEAYLIRSEIYKDMNEFEKAESDIKSAKSKSKILNMILNNN